MYLYAKKMPIFCIVELTDALSPALVYLYVLTRISFNVFHTTFVQLHNFYDNP